MLPNGSGQPTVVTHVDGVRFSIQVRSHEILVDQTLRGGGTDSAPTPLELLGAALGSCIAYYVRQYLKTRDLPTEGLRVEVVQNKVSNPSRIDEFLTKVILPAELDDSFIPMIERVIQTCPAHNTLKLGAAIDVSIAAPAAMTA
jgi:putative redox protein